MKSRDINKLRTFKKYRNQLNKELKKAKSDYFNNVFSSTSNKDYRDSWAQLNSVLNLRSIVSPKTIEHDGTVLSGKALSDKFNNFFINVTRSLCCSSNSPRGYAYQAPSVKESLFMSPTTEIEVQQIYKDLRLSKALDIDGFQIQPFKYVIDLIAPVLAFIYNLSLSTGIFPRQMQIAKCVAIHKGGSISNFSNYRPVSILPVLSKGLEKIIYIRINNFLSKHTVLSECQFGFRKCRSTETTLLKQKETIIKAFEAKHLALGIYVDFSKAFDVINHTILLDKLFHYGIRGSVATLIRSYLEHRRQVVAHNNIFSDMQPIVSGVLQGSILGPLLFLLYINDIFYSSLPGNMITYVDDITMIVSGSTETTLSAYGNQFLEYLQQWCGKNYLKVNTDKTKAVIYRAKNKIIRDSIKLVYGNTIIDIVSNIKSLGVVFSETLSWDLQIDKIRNKMNKINGVICKHRYSLPTGVKLVIYNAFLLPAITYCHTVWGTTTKKNILKLLVAQKRTVRLIVNVPWYAHTEHYFEKYHVIKVNTLYAFRLLVMYKNAISRNNESFISIPQLTRHATSYNVRQRLVWFLPFFRTNYRLQSLCYILPLYLNCLESNNICLEKTSKKQLYTVLYLLESL